MKRIKEILIADKASIGVTLAGTSQSKFVTPIGLKAYVEESFNDSELNFPYIIGVREKGVISATAATGAINLDVLTANILDYTTNATGNFTLNIRGNSTTTLNSIMAIGDYVTVAFICTNGTTAYYCTAITVDGNAPTIAWLNKVIPTSGVPSAKDRYILNIKKTADATFTVFASQITWG